MCGIGTYSSTNGTSACTSCGAGKTTATEGSTASTDCVDQVSGCTDPSACNYNANAETNDGSCICRRFYDCDGNCLIDADGDGVAPLEVAGCTDSTACNYDAIRTTMMVRANMPKTIKTKVIV